MRVDEDEVDEGWMKGLEHKHTKHRKQVHRIDISHNLELKKSVIFVLVVRNRYKYT